MIWKPKEKELTAEEAVALAKKELTPFWYGTTPLFAGVKNENQFAILPLDPEFAKKSWLIFFVDPTDYTGESAVIYAKEWGRRYGQQHLDILFVFAQTYRFLASREPIRQIIEKQTLEFPIVVDTDETISISLGATTLPKILLLKNGSRYFEYCGTEWMLSAEFDIQNFLRGADPGLPLLPALSSLPGVVRDVLRMEFGAAPKIGNEISYPFPGFVQNEKGEREGHFLGTRPKAMEPGDLFIGGVWKQDDEKIITHDPRASLGFCSPSEKFSFVAEPLHSTKDFIKIPMISIEVNGLPPYEAILGEDMSTDESGVFVIKVENQRIYHVLIEMPEGDREITLRMINADKNPVCIYGLRFGVDQS